MIAHDTIRLTTLLLGDTDGPATAAGRLGVLTAHAQAPVVTETTVGADLLEALEIVTELRVDTVGKNLRVLAVDNVALSVEEPAGNLVLRGVLDNGDDSLQLFRGELTGAVYHGQNHMLDTETARVVSLKAYRLFRSTSAFLQTKLEYRRPTPLMRVIAYITFSSPVDNVSVLRSTQAIRDDSKKTDP
jgi:hypothetical protein